MGMIGNAPAQGLFDSGNIKDGGVATIDIADSAVTTAKIADSNVTTAKIADANVTTQKVADGAVTAAKLASSAVTDKLGYAPVNKAGDTMTGNLSIVKARPVINLDDTTQDVGVDVAIGNINEAFYVFEPEDSSAPQVPDNLGREWFRIDDDGEAYLHQTKKFWHNAAMPRPVLRVSHYESSSMIATSASVDVTFFSLDVTKVSSTSRLYVTGSIPTSGSSNHGIYWFVSYAGTKRFFGVSDGWRSHGSNDASVPGGIHINSVSQPNIAAGTVTVGFGLSAIDGSANQPYMYLNPNTSIDGRNRNGTVMTVWEVEQ